MNAKSTRKTILKGYELNMRVLKNTSNKRLLYLPPESIKQNPFASRKPAMHDEDRQLYESIRDNGLLQPITVKKNAKFQSYEVVCGQRRLDVCKRLQIKQIPCIEIEADDFESCLFSLIENLKRDDLSFFEEAKAIDLLIKQWGLTQIETAKLLSTTQSALSNKLRLLKLTSSQQHSIEKIGMTERHARALVRIADDNLRDKALDEIIVKRLNVQQTERLIDEILKPIEKSKPKKSKIKSGKVTDMRFFVNSIEKAVKLMQQSGINAKTHTDETEEYISYTVVIPKSKAALG